MVRAPCSARPALASRGAQDFLTLYGLMFFDTDDLAFLQQNNILDEVVVHEMGHVLGLGTLWDFNRDLLQGTAADPRFVGPNAIAGFHDVGGRGATIPVEEGGGPGTRFSHWDEETFEAELMTGFIALGRESAQSHDDRVDAGSRLRREQQRGRSLPGDRTPGTGGRWGSDRRRLRINLGARERLIRPVGVVN